MTDFSANWEEMVEVMRSPCICLSNTINFIVDGVAVEKTGSVGIVGGLF